MGVDVLGTQAANHSGGHAVAIEVVDVLQHKRLAALNEVPRIAIGDPESDRVTKLTQSLESLVMLGRKFLRVVPWLEDTRF